MVVSASSGRITVTLDIIPDDDDPHALLAAEAASGDLLARIRVHAGFKLSAASAGDWIDTDFRKPG